MRYMREQYWGEPADAAETAGREQRERAERQSRRVAGAVAVALALAALAGLLTLPPDTSFLSSPATTSQTAGHLFPNSPGDWPPPPPPGGFGPRDHFGGPPTPAPGAFGKW